MKRCVGHVLIWEGVKSNLKKTWGPKVLAKVIHGQRSYTTIIQGFSKVPIWLRSPFLLVDMYILTRGPRLEWHMYLMNGELDLNDLFDYVSTWTCSQVGQKNEHFGQNGQWLLIN